MSDIRAYVESHPLFCHHDHHCSFKDFDEQRAQANFQSLLGYATADLVVAAGTERLDESQPLNDALVARLWPVVRNITPGIVIGTLSGSCLAARLSSGFLKGFFICFIYY